MNDAQRFDSDPERGVMCRICSLAGVDYRTQAKRLMGHIGGKHRNEGWDKAKYLSRFGGGGAINDFAFFKPDENARQEARNRLNVINAEKNAEQKRVEASKFAETDAQVDAADPLSVLVAANKELLKPHERKFYEEFFNMVLQAVDRDELQIPAISSLAFDIVLTKRLRERQFKGTGTEELEKSIKTLEDRVAKQMNVLGISREAQLKNKVQLKSTPASLISGYLDEIERMSPEALDTLRVEEQRVLARMQPRVERLILANAPDLPKDEQDDESLDGPVLSFEEALRRANIAL